MSSKHMVARARRNAETGLSVLERLPGILQCVPDWLAGGVRTSDGPKVSGGGTRGLDGEIINEAAADDDPPQKALRDRRDSIAAHVQGIEQELAHIEAAYGRLSRHLQSLTVLDVEEARRLSNEDTARTWQCANPSCRQVFTYDNDQRPRAERCEPCYRWRKEHAGEDRPHRLVHREPAPACEDCVRVHPKERVA